MLGRRLIRFLTGWRKFEIYSTEPPQNLCLRLEKAVTPEAPHGIFRDWRNPKPFMGVVTNSHFNLREKSRFGQGWPAKLDGRFNRGADKTTVYVATYPTGPEVFVLCTGFPIILVFLLAGLFLNGTEASPITFVDRVFLIGAPVVFAGFFRHDSNERADRVKQTLSGIFETPK